jgi:hypothetical protein
MLHVSCLTKVAYRIDRYNRISLSVCTMPTPRVQNFVNAIVKTADSPRFTLRACISATTSNQNTILVNFTDILDLDSWSVNCTADFPSPPCIDNRPKLTSKSLRTKSMWLFNEPTVYIGEATELYGSSGAAESKNYVSRG